jgi:hypothetical protein
MSNKEKQWKMVVALFKAEAKKRYLIGDVINTPYNSGVGYRIHKGSVYRVHFEEGGEYEMSWVCVSVSDSTTSVVAEVYDGLHWNFPSYNTNEKLDKRDWKMSDDITNAYKLFISFGKDGFKPLRKPY